ncbi:MAG: sulfatase-like hydrolase/transferase, partial [Nitrospinota bacterium]
SVLQVYQHFVKEIFFGFFFLFLLSAGLYYLASFFPQFLKDQKKIILLVLGCSLVVMSWPGGVIKEVYSIYQIVNAKRASFYGALKSLGIDPKSYISPERLTAKSGKNIIVISLESIELGFMSKEFKNLMPNLSALSKEWTLYQKMPQGPGSNWTAGSVYTHQSGVPAFFKQQRNEIFQGTERTRIVGLGHVLEEANYNSVYMMGNPEFGGIKDMLNTYKLPVKSEKNIESEYSFSDWGFHDLDLFKEAKKEVLRLKTSDNPFALFLSTVSTHFPDGVYDERMEAVISRQENKLEFMVKSVDHMLGAFIRFLKEEGLLENTAVYIFPDHYLMGTTGPVVEKLNRAGRQLFLLTNIEEGELPFKSSESIYQIDLPKIFMEGAGIDSNAVFFTDYVPRQDVTGFLNARKLEIVSLNEASLSRSNFLRGLQVNLEDGKLLLSSNEYGSETTLPRKGEDGTYVFVFNEDMNLLLYKDLADKQSFVGLDFNENLLFLEMDVKNNLITGTFSKGAEKRVFNGKNQIDITENHISQLIFGARQSTWKRSFDEINRNGRDVDRFIAHAGGGIDGYTYTNSLESLNASYDRGFRIFEIDFRKTSDGYYVGAHDWKLWSKATGYLGKLPPDINTFRKYKLYGVFTPLDMSKINTWFEVHQDAVLVTDKVNEPRDFSSKFIDKERLMMELFTVESLREGLRLNLRAAMATWSLVATIPGDVVSTLLKIGVKYVAVSRREIKLNSKLLYKLKESGIKVYGFHVNYDPGKDEKFSVCHDMDFIYGIYADNWDFPLQVECQDN